MKKMFLLLTVILFTTTATLAFTMPRWSYFPIKVYVPEHPKASLIKEALNDWQGKSGGLISFKDSKSKISANIVFDIKDSCGQIGYTNIHAATTYLFKVDVTMCSSVPNISVTEQKFKSSALHEVALAIGLKPTETEENITYSDFYGAEIYPAEITDEDVQSLNNTYKDNSMKSNIKKKDKQE